MRAAYLDDARQDLVSQATREVLTRRGALISDHRGSRVLFRGYKPGGRWTWDRGGYVGIYQHTGEREVEVRLLLRARWPFRLLWGAALLSLVAVLATLALDPPGTTWFSVAAICAFALLVTGVLYVNTWRPVWREERELMQALEEEFARDLTGADLETEEERERRRLEEDLEGEVTRRKLTALKAGEPKPERRGITLPRPKFNLKRKSRESPPEPAAEVEAAPGGGSAPARTSRFPFPAIGRKPRADEPAAPAASSESLEERKARLLARKAELEARQREKGNP